ILPIVVIGVPVLVASVFWLRFGVVVTLTASFFILGIKKFLPGEAPLGLLLDLLVFLMFFGLLVKISRDKDLKAFYSPISVIVFVWIMYNLLEVANPYAESRMAWFYTVRGLAGIVLLFYIVTYTFSDFKYIKQLSLVLIILALLAGLYGLAQEFMGFNRFEYAWIYAEEQRFKLIYQWGRFRKFSFLSDPTTFGILCSYMLIFSAVLLMGKNSRNFKIFLGFTCIVLFLGMIYSGTRTAYVMLPAGGIFYALLTLRKQILALMVLGILFLGFVIMIPTSNPNLYRFQSAFKPQKERSLNVRLDNQKMIQPFIQSHPMGGGAGSTGTWGKRFSPNSFLANFPPDSGYVRIAVELGWLGLFIYCSMFFIVLQTGIYNYIRCTQAEIKTYYEAFLTLIFVLTLANYPQEAVILVPNSLVYFISAAALIRLKDFNNQLSYA
ncbi:MAG: O-antigen ligase family protein, partial [Bacteroidetes bacterium]|nr:O-antigen ligase family protein [Bacteroidota bacterium]